VTKQIYGGTGNFVMEVFTPLSLYRIQTEMARQVAQARAGRERTGGASAAESFSPFDDLFSWAQYVGAYSPVVLLRVAPKVGETTGSSIGNVIAAAAAGYSGTAYYGSHRLEFKGDLKDMRIENTNQVDEISRGMTFIPLVLDESTMWATYSGTDLARAGLLVLPLEMFAPAPTTDMSGTTYLAWPAVTVVVEDLKRQPVSEQRFIVPRVTVEQIWVDFAAYREQLGANAARLNLSGTPQ
jgi:hypothetical protein